VGSSEIEDLVARYVALASKPVLSKAEHKEAQEVMRSLREAGMSIQEISRLSNGRWSESTVKGYCPGIRPAGRGPWKDATDLLEELRSRNLTLEDVTRALAIDTDAKSRGIQLSQLAGVMAAADASSWDATELVDWIKECGEQNLKVRDVGRLLAQSRELEEKGLSLGCLPDLVKLARGYGNPEEVIHGLSAYGTLTDIEKSVHEAEGRLSKLDGQISSAERHLSEANKGLAEKSRALKAVERVRKLGFGEHELVQIADVAEKCGGAKLVLKAITVYRELQEINKETEQAKLQYGKWQNAVSQLQAEHGCLRTAIDMCQRLIKEQRYGLDAVMTIISVAQKFGEATSVLKAIEAYGSLQSLAQTEQGLQGRTQEKQQLLEQLEGRYKEALDMMDALNGKCVAAGTQVAEIESKLAGNAGVRNAIDFLWNPASVGFEEGGPTALAIAVTFRRWVERHQQRLPHGYSIKSGMDFLIGDLGG